MTPARAPFLRRGRRVVLAICIVLWITALFVTHCPRGQIPGLDLPGETSRGLGGLLHALGYFALAGAFWLTLAAYGLSLRRRLALVIGVFVAYGALDEITQPLFGRQADLFDWLADLIGATAAALVATGISAVRAAARRPPA